ncbi:hypothetical protein A8L34_03435 [Bacillus sp. FJAT-27264]|uniref:hypothetical protein n=1 Tax=Paenibacillus sp. (strain DSM 101736 / FJAT-27264) TaxID=1850362 RepID=UPI000807CF51|nr:hypothetical protein [Bacillus sp. FJAT-27264]OBZ18635.1 hypothetical protein A8L34_03435 [Bacillus sp. FJAT-27264]
MNYSLKFRNVALSALLLTAISAPIVANADSAANENAVKNGTATLKQVQSSVPAFTMANPVELAKKYSPDTVNEWEKTLAKYNKLLSQSPASDTIATLVAVDVDADQLKKALENAKPGEIKEAQPLKVEGGKQYSVEGVKANKLPNSEEKNTLTFSKTFNSAELQKLVENAKPGEAIAVRSVKLDDKATGITSAAIANTDTYQLSVATTATNAFFSAQTKLQDAITAKDTAAIKSSLAELLKQYKAQIAELEAAQN